MAETAGRPPGTEDALRFSITEYGVVHPVKMTEDRQIIDGALRYRIAQELGIPVKVELEPMRRHVALAHRFEQERLRKHNERAALMTHQIIRLASIRDGTGVGRWAEEVIAAAVGVSTDYVLKTMARHLKPSQEDVREMFPRERRTVNGGVTAAAVTTADVVPLPRVLPMPALHEVTDFIPELDDNAYAALKADIKLNGLKEPVSLTPHGVLVDGRARWRACSELGFVPETKTVVGDPWKYALATNVVRFPNIWDRMLIFASLPVRRDLPSAETLSDQLRIQFANARSFRRVVAAGHQELIDAVINEQARLWSVVRIIREQPEHLWETTLRAELAGGNIRTKPKPKSAVPADTGLKSRRGTIGETEIRKILEQLAALGMVLDSATGLDPAMTREQATSLFSSLSTERRHVGRLATMLKQRKETT